MRCAAARGRAEAAPGSCVIGDLSSVQSDNRDYVTATPLMSKRGSLELTA